ncbi:MAG TPA: hypothetical protein VD886_04235 [Herpetosiphonaceae bacterium]|nr:hypothetical protein [Herpetosiphonaceae bacterium]
MIQGLDQLQQAADYHYYFRRLRRLGLGLAAFGLLLGGLAWVTRDNRWSAAALAVTAAWSLAYAVLVGDPLVRGWLRSRPLAGHWLTAAALLILGGLFLAERRFAPAPGGRLPVTLGAAAVLTIFGVGSLVAYHRALGSALWGKRRPLPGMLKQLDEQIAAIKNGDLARDRSLIEFAILGGKLRAALRPGMVVLLGRGGHLLYYRRKQVVITPGEPGRATLQLADEQLDIAITPAMLDRFQAGGR